MVESLPVAGIGSLPHTNVAEAIRFALETAPLLPSLPQLPKHSKTEMMVAQLAAWDGRNPPAAEHGFAALTPFAAALREQNRTRAKIQLIGPITAAACIAGTHATDHAPRVIALLRALADSINVPNVVAQIDEPLLSAADESSLKVLRQCIQSLQYDGREVWLHCCGTVDWKAMISAGADVCSIDAWLTPPPAMLPDQTKIALGVVPTTGTPGTQECLVKAREWLARSPVPTPDWRRRVIITPACGLGMSTMETAVEIMGSCNTVAQQLRHQLA